MRVKDRFKKIRKKVKKIREKRKKEKPTREVKIKGKVFTKKEIEEKLWIPCCHLAGMHDPIHFENRKYICTIQLAKAFKRFCSEIGIDPKTKADPSCYLCLHYPSYKSGEGLALSKCEETEMIIRRGVLYSLR